MARSVKIPKKTRRFFLALLLFCWSTGLTFFIMNRWLSIEGEFGTEKHPWQFGVLKSHGAAAFLMMMTFGFLLSSHVSVSWPVKRMRGLGLMLVSAVSFLIISAYGLYYLGNEEIRTIVAYAHFFVGLSLPLMVVVHIYMGRKTRARSNGARPKPAPE